MFQDKNIPHTPLKEIGEFGLIDIIKKNTKTFQNGTLKGIGDDAATLSFGNKKTLISTDMLTEGVHFNLAYTPLRHLGYKAVATNISDICAMNGSPTHITVSIAVSDRFSLEAIQELYQGIHFACRKYNIDLVGGDTTASHSGLVISITAVGEANEANIVYRNGAKNKDLVIVTGDLGGAYFGLQILERENQVWKANPLTQPDLTPYDYIIGRQLKPEARTDIIQLLKKLKVKPTAMIDISDGLASELLHLSEQSKVGFTIYEEKIPLDPQVINAGEEFNVNATMGALNGGEDYELLFTLPLREYDKIKANPNFTVIGFANPLEEGNHLIGRGNTTKIPLSAQGWDAFKKYKEMISKEKQNDE